MSAKSLLGVVAWGLGLGLIVAAFNGDRRLISVQVWLVVFSAWFGISILIRFFREVRLPHDSLLGQWPLPRRNKQRPKDDRPSDLRNIEVVLHRAVMNPRAHQKQLRPQLIGLAQHYLPVHHGLDPERQPAQVAALLGDTAWLIDPTEDEATPTLDEISRFLDRVAPLADSPHSSPSGKGLQ